MSIADELITRGWTQGDFVDDETGAVCLEGAAACSTGKEPREEYDRQVSNAVRDAVKAVTGSILVVSFNDADGRTFDEVLRVAKLADEILDAQRAEPTQPQ